MRSFTIGDYRFDVLSHERTVANGRVREQFIIDGFYQGQPLNWQPNHKGSEDFPGIPNRMIYSFHGREVVDVYENTGTTRDPVYTKVGTKRGADFRTRFFPILMLLAEKAVVAAQAGKRIGEVRDSELQKAAFMEPVTLKTRTLDEAVTELTVVR